MIAHPNKRMRDEATAIDANKNDGYFGIYMGVVVNDADDQNHVRVKVHVYGVSPYVANPLNELLTNKADIPGIWCSPLFPSFGTTRVDGSNIEDEPISFGVIPPLPRKGDTVAVAFIGGSTSSAIWIGSIPADLSCMTVPGLPAVGIRGDTDYLPGAERSRNDPKTKEHKPAGVLAENIKTSGLANDLHRGAGISGLTRESPTRVSGIKSRGNPVNGMPGHVLVFDDLPETQHIRLRSSAGHQILLSDTGKTIYISTAQGNSRVELYESGDIDVYSEANVSVHARNDLSLYVGGNFNLDVRGNMFTSVGGSVWSEVSGNVHTKIGGGMKLETVSDLNILSGASMKLKATTTLHGKAQSEIRLQCDADMHLKSGPYMRLTAATQVLSDGAVAQGADDAASADAPAKISLPGPKTTAQSRAGQEASNVQTVVSKLPQREPYKDSSRILEDALRVTEHGEPSPFDFDEHDLNRAAAEAASRGVSTRAGMTRLTDTGGKDASQGQEIPKENVQYLVVHGSAHSANSANVTKADIEALHKRTANVGNRLAYHFVIQRDGTVEPGVPIAPRVIHGNHTGKADINRMSIGICMIGGGKTGNVNQGEANYTTAQRRALREKIQQLLSQFPSIKYLCGHRDIKPTTVCPSFDVQMWWKNDVFDEKTKTPLKPFR